MPTHERELRSIDLSGDAGVQNSRTVEQVLADIRNSGEPALLIVCGDKTIRVYDADAALDLLKVPHRVETVIQTVPSREPCPVCAEQNTVSSRELLAKARAVQKLFWLGIAISVLGMLLGLAPAIITFIRLLS